MTSTKNNSTEELGHKKAGCQHVPPTPCGICYPNQKLKIPRT